MNGTNKLTKKFKLIKKFSKGFYINEQNLHLNTHFGKFTP